MTVPAQKIKLCIKYFYQILPISLMENINFFLSLLNEGCFSDIKLRRFNWLLNFAEIRLRCQHPSLETAVIKLKKSLTENFIFCTVVFIYAHISLQLWNTISPTALFVIDSSMGTSGTYYKCYPCILTVLWLQGDLKNFKILKL